MSEARRQAGSIRLVGLVVAALALVGVAIVVVWAVARDDTSPAPAERTANVVAASEEELRELAEEVEHPVYWAGPSDTDTYELTRTTNGNIYIRYLPEGVDIGDPAPKYTTVVTYPSPTAHATLERAAKREDATAFRFESGALSVTYEKTPTSVYFAFPSSPYLVEVFDPSPVRARELVKSGQVAVIR